MGDGDETSVPFLCECPDAGCTQIVLLTLGEYGRVRGRARQALVAHGHEDLLVERVVEQNDRFVLTEKLGSAGRAHEEGDPRG